MLGPVALAPLESASESELHLEKESAACAVPEPTFTVNVRNWFLALSEPENESVWLLGVGEDVTAAATVGVASEIDVAAPTAFDAVTATRIVEPTSPICRA
jgi:hypothetical protein